MGEADGTVRIEKWPTPGEVLLVLNKDENTVSYIDPADRRTLKVVSVDVNPHEVAITANGRKSYVTNSGGNTVSILDNNAMEETHRIEHEGFKFPHGVGLSGDESKLYIASTYAGRVFVIDTSSLKVLKTINTHQDLVHMIYFDPKKERVLVPNIGSNNITILDTATDEVVTHIPVGRGPEGAAVHPEGKQLYVANQHDNNLSIIDLEDFSLQKKLRLGTVPIRLVFSPDGRYAFIPNRESGDLSIVDCNRPWEIKRIPLGVWPGGVVFSSDGSFAYVANNKTNDVSVISVESLKELGRIDAGIHPDGIGIFTATIVV